MFSVAATILYQFQVGDGIEIRYETSGCALGDGPLDYAALIIAQVGSAAPPP